MNLNDKQNVSNQNYDQQLHYQQLNQHYQQVQTHQPQPVIHVVEGNKETDDKNSALKSFQQAVNTDNKYQDAYYELGEIYFSLEKYNEAKSIFTILLNENPSYSKRDNIDKMLSAIKNL